MTSNTKTVAFFGASYGVGLAALKQTLASGHQCIALCRKPSKLTAAFPKGVPSNLRIVEGNAHDITAVTSCLRSSDGKVVDIVMSSIGAAPTATLSVDDKDVCKKGISTLFSALASLRQSGVTANPHIIAVSTAGFSRFGRDIPIPMIPVYKLFVRVPGADKMVMEDRLVESGEGFTIVRCSHLTNGESETKIRVGIEDPKKGRETEVIGYSISREDAGKWVADNLILKREGKFENKIAMISY